MSSYNYEDLSKMIDHSLLHPTMSESVLEEGIQLAIAYDVASVCIMPYYLKRCAELLSDTTVKASTTIGFPHGGHTTAIKVAETKQAIQDGCQEFDMVVNVSKVLSGDWTYVTDDIRAVTDVVHEAGEKVKVIFENCYLEEAHKIRLCEICSEQGCDWVKTSTGYGTGGATIEDLKLMRKHSAANVQVKAAGGVRDAKTLIEVKELGVSRVGASRTKSMMDEVRQMLNLKPIEVSDTANPSGY